MNGTDRVGRELLRGRLSASWRASVSKLSAQRVSFPRRPIGGHAAAHGPHGRRSHRASPGL